MSLNSLFRSWWAAILLLSLTAGGYAQDTAARAKPNAAAPFSDVPLPRITAGSDFAATNVPAPAKAAPVVSNLKQSAGGKMESLDSAAKTKVAPRAPADTVLPGPTTAEPVAIPGAQSASGRKMESLDEKQKLAVGDRVTFRVLEDQEDPKALTVTDAGELDVPELGLVEAAGKTCKQLAFEVKAKLEQTTYYKATVILGIDQLNKTISGRRVYVSGQVQRTGPQEIPGGETWTVAKAIMRAGGFTEYADKKKVRLVRAGKPGSPGVTMLVNVAEILEKGRTELDQPVQAEDLIFVPARAVNFY